MSAVFPAKFDPRPADPDEADSGQTELRSLRTRLTSARAMTASRPAALHSGIAELDRAFGDAVRPGHIIEWGIPQGRNGRVIPLLFLRQHPGPLVWVYGDPALQVYAPAWASLGMDLERLFFIRSSEPVRQLRPLFLDNSFGIIVLDAPHRLSRGELAFISQQARRNAQRVFLIRNYFLGVGRGTALAGMRVNCWQNRQGGYTVHVIKGQGGRKIQLDAAAVCQHGS